MWQRPNPAALLLAAATTTLAVASAEHTEFGDGTCAHQGVFLNHYYKTKMDDDGNRFTTPTCKTRCSAFPECIAISFERTLNEGCCLLHGFNLDLDGQDIGGEAWSLFDFGVDQETMHAHTIDSADTQSGTAIDVPVSNVMRCFEKVAAATTTTTVAAAEHTEFGDGSCANNGQGLNVNYFFQDACPLADCKTKCSESLECVAISFFAINTECHLHGTESDKVGLVVGDHGGTWVGTRTSVEQTPIATQLTVFRP